MANIPTTVSLSETDKKLAARCRRTLQKYYGTVTFSFIVRQALRALDEKLNGD